MNKLTSALLGLAFALAIAPVSVAAHSFGVSGGGMHGGGMMDPGKLSDEYLDRLGELMAQRYESMQAIAAEQDAEARRELVREHFNAMHPRHREGGGDEHQGQSGDWMMGPGMMGPGMMGPGMMGPGMMGPGMMGPGMMGPGMMGPGMMRYDRLNDEYLDLIGEHMAEQHARMTRIAETSDKTERRRLVREHYVEMAEFMEKMHGQ